MSAERKYPLIVRVLGLAVVVGFLFPVAAIVFVIARLCLLAMSVWDYSTDTMDRLLTRPRELLDETLDNWRNR